jgi:hypothetical protein
MEAPSAHAYRAGPLGPAGRDRGDRGGGTGEPVAALLRPGNAGSNTAADYITATRLALAQLPRKYRQGRRALILCDYGGGTHEFVAWLAQRGRWLSYSVGLVIAEAIHPARSENPRLGLDVGRRDRRRSP